MGLVKAVGDAENANPAFPIPHSKRSVSHGAGTPGYGAPEQMERGEVSFVSDIHALGVMADRCFNGRLSRAWIRIIRRATSSIPAHRYPSVAAFARAIRRRNLLLGVSAFVAVIALSGLCLPCFYSWWTQSGREVWRWRALCDYGEIVSVSRICEPLDESHPKYPESIVRYVTNRVDGTILNLPKDTLSFARPILLKPGEYRIVGPGRLDVDLSGPSNAVVRLKDCVLNNMTDVPYPQNGIHYVLEGGAYLNFANLDRNIESRRYIQSDGKTRNALRFRGPTTFKELDEEQAREYERMLQCDLQ
jgi:serine/threonine protein kinase